MRYVDKFNGQLRIDLTGLEGEIGEFRGDLTSTKHDRDSVRLDIKELKRQQGFATSDLLIVDYENRKSKLDQVKATIREFKDRYNILLRQVEAANALTQKTSDSSGNGAPGSLYWASTATKKK